MGWVGLVYKMLWVGLGLYFGGLGWVGFQKVDPCPCLVYSVPFSRYLTLRYTVTLKFRLVITHPANICMMCTKSTDPEISFATDSMGLSLFTSTQRAQENSW